MRRVAEIIRSSINYEKLTCVETIFDEYKNGLSREGEQS
jgi:hypothetical protein